MRRHGKSTRSACEAGRADATPSSTPTCSPALPRPCSSDLLPRDMLVPKRRTPEMSADKRPMDDDMAPHRPAKRSTPRPSGPSTFVKQESGKFVLHRIPSMENMARGESVFKTYFCDERVLGKGSYGTVYDARYKPNDRRYAVKILCRRNTESETENEVLQVSFLQAHPHPNCLAYFFAWTDRKFDEHGIVSEMCERGSLKSELAASALSEQQVWDYFIDLLHGLDHIHGNRLRHFDIKPENLFVTADRVLRIGDFGVASPIGCTHELGRGTAPYAAPELLTEDIPLEEAGTSADMYSAGVVLYEMVSDYEVAQNARTWQPPPPDRAFHVLASLCVEMMHREPKLRPSAAQLLLRPEIGVRAHQRALQVAQTMAPPDVFPSPVEMSGVRYNQLAQNAPAARVARNLFE